MVRIWKKSEKIGLTYFQEKNNAKTGVYKFSKKKSSSHVKILGDRTVARSKRYKGGSQILGVEPGNCAALGYETNVLTIDCRIIVASRSPSTVVFGSAFRCGSRMRQILTWMAIIKMLQKQLNGEPTINYTHTMLKMSLLWNVSISASGWLLNITEILQFAEEVPSRGDGMQTETTNESRRTQLRPSPV